MAAWACHTFWAGRNVNNHQRSQAEVRYKEIDKRKRHINMVMGVQKQTSCSGKEGRLSRWGGKLMLSSQGPVWLER